MVRHKIPVHLPHAHIPESQNNSALKQFIVVAESFFAETLVINKPELPLSFYRYYGIEKFKEHNLAEVGVSFNITRERARQRISELNNSIKKLVSGDLVLTPRVDYDIRYTDLLRKFTNQLDMVNVITNEEVIDLLQPENDREKSWVYALMGIAGYVKNNHNGIPLFRKRSISMKNIVVITTQIDALLREKILPLSLKDISIELGFPSAFVQTILNLMPHIERGNGTYFHHDQNLNSTKNCIYRIFTEAQKVLSIDEIKKEIVNRGLNAPSNLNLTQDDRFQSVGKTGVWGLREWNIDNAPIYDVMLDALRFLNKPVTVKQLTECVRNRRPNVKQETIYTYLTQYRNLFTFFEGNLIVPSEDREKYPNLKLKRKPARKFYASQEDVDKIFTSYLKEHGKATSKELFEEVKRHYPYSWNGFYVRMTGSRILKYDDSVSPRLYSIDKQAKKVIYKKQLKTEIVREAILKVLKKKKGYRMAFSKLISQICAATGCNRIMVYKVVAESKEFTTKRMRKDSRAKEITLSF